MMTLWVLGCSISLSWVLPTPFQGCAPLEGWLSGPIRSMLWMYSDLHQVTPSLEKEELSSLSTPILECLFSWAQHGQIGMLPRNTTLAAPLGAKEPFHVYSTALIFWLDGASPILLFGEWVFFLKSSLGQIGGIILDHSDSGNTQERTWKKLLLSDLISKNCWGWTVIKLNGRPQCIHSPNKPHLLPYKSDIFPDGEAVTFERNNCP